MPAVLEPILPLDDEPVTLADQHAFNLKVWAQMLADPELARYEFRVESDEHGRAVLIPPPAPEHGEKQSEIVRWLHALLSHGRVITECPVSTRHGVKGADVAWTSLERRRAQKGQVALTQAPQICVEIMSPDNSPREMNQKRAAYFETGAEEVWFCQRDGRMEFFLKSAPETAGVSVLCPAFPARIDVEI